jgi:transcriptional regulator with XRE-family HTH domain
LAEVSSPTLRRRELGALLRGLRTERGLTVEQVAERLLCSPSKVSRMETGHRGATLRDIRDLCDFYEVSDHERDHMSRLAVQSKEQGWWQSFEFPYRTYVGLEAAAAATKYYQSAIVPGLLQTPEYARAMHEVVVPELDQSRIDELIEIRVNRKKRLTEDPPLAISAIIDEAVLHREVGGPHVMHEQLRSLVDVASRPNVTIQVIPYSAGAHPAMDSTFRILEFDGVSDVVYVEGLVGWIYLDQAKEIARYHQVFERLCAVALDPRHSVELITGIAAQHQAAQSLRRSTLAPR